MTYHNECGAKVYHGIKYKGELIGIQRPSYREYDNRRSVGPGPTNIRSDRQIF